jgi:hypothetical protein
MWKDEGKKEAKTKKQKSKTETDRLTEDAMCYTSTHLTLAMLQGWREPST